MSGGKKKDDEEDKDKKKRNNKHGNGTEKVSEVYITNVKTPLDRNSGDYQISFVSDEKVDNLMLGIRIGSDDDNMARAEISKATLNGKTLAIKNGLIEIGSATEGEKKIVRVKLTETGRKTLEVRAYAKR